MANEGQIAVELANKMSAVCRGQPSAAVYIAVAMMLAAAEYETPKPDRKRLFRLLSDAMDDYLPKLKQ